MIFKNTFRRVLAAFAALLALGGTGMAAASTLSADWYTLAVGHPDTELAINGLTLGLVSPNLGPNGQPVRSAFSAGFAAGNSNNITNVNGSDEILWWTPQAGLVSVNNNYPSTVAVPFNVPANLFPGGIGVGNNGSPFGYLAAHLYGTFVTPASGSVTLTLGADDDAWIFINGQLVVDNGGVKALSAVPTVIAGLASGSNTIDVFFADRHVVQSGLVFSADVIFNPKLVPEPPTMAVVLVGLIGLAGMAGLRRRAA